MRTTSWSVQISLTSQGISLSTTTLTQTEVEPLTEECVRLRQWRDMQESQLAFHTRALTNNKFLVEFNRANTHSLHQIRDMEESSDSFSVQATILHINAENLYYPACRGPNCFKRLTREGDLWCCDKCGTKAQVPDYR